MSQPSPDARVAKESQEFTITLYTINRHGIGSPDQLECTFEYLLLDIETPTSVVYLKSINGNKGPGFPVRLYPAELEDKSHKTIFIGGGPDVSVPIDHFTVICNHVWLVRDSKDEHRSASIIMGKGSDLIFQSDINLGEKD